MNYKKTYDRFRDLSFRMSINAPRYLLGLDVHNSYKDKRKEIKSEENLVKRVSKLSLNYAMEGFRQMFKYLPLAIEGLILYGNLTDDIPLSSWFYTAFPFRLIDAYITMEDANDRDMNRDMNELSKSLKSLEEMLNDFSNTFSEFARDRENLFNAFSEFEETMRGFRETVRNNPKFSALIRGKLISDPYSILGIEGNADEKQIKRAYREIVLKYHPDSCGNDPVKIEMFINATKAYQQLTGQFAKL